jgi:hypothetical protein
MRPSGCRCRCRSRKFGSPTPLPYHEQSARPRIPIEEAEHPEEEAGADAVGGDRQPPVVVDKLEVEIEGVDVDVE